MRTIPKIAVEIVKDSEECKLQQYLDSNHIPTIAWGHTAAMHDGKLPLTCTLEQAEQWLIEDMQESANAVLGMVNVPLNDWQFGALTSLCFNLGQGKLKDDSIIRKINEYDYHGAVNDFWMIRRSGGKILKGLQKRRSIERHYFLTGEYFSQDRDALYSPGGRLFYHDETHPSNIRS